MRVRMVLMVEKDAILMYFYLPTYHDTALLTSFPPETDSQSGVCSH